MHTWLGIAASARSRRVSDCWRSSLAVSSIRWALYRLEQEEFYTDLDCAVLVGAERQVHDCNDDAMGRALVNLFESPVGQTFAGLRRQAGNRLGLGGTATVHADTTSVTLYG